MDTNDFWVSRILKGYDEDYERKNKVHTYLKKYSTKEIIKVVIVLDNEDGLSNWDYCEADSLEGAIGIIDGGFGILEIVSE